MFHEENQYEDDTNSLQVKPTPRTRKNVPPPVAPRRRTTVGFEKDRSMTEVSDGEAVEENFEKFGVWQDKFYSIRFDQHFWCVIAWFSCTLFSKLKMHLYLSFYR